MSKVRPPIRIEFHIDRATMRRTVIICGSLVLLAIGGISFAVPVSFTDGNVLTAKQLNDDFTSVENRLAALEAPGGPGARYVVKASIVVPGNSPGHPIIALCNPGDRVLMGSCTGDNAAPLTIWKNEPVIVGTNGWRCGANVMYGIAQSLQALAVCSGTGPDRSLDGGIDVEAGTCPGTAAWRSAQFPPSASCQACAATLCCTELTACLLGGCPIGNGNNSLSNAVATCMSNSCAGC